MKKDFAWKIILGCIFLRPFISESAFPRMDFILQGILLPSSLIYLSGRQFKQTAMDKFIFIFLLSMVISALTAADIVGSVSQMYKYISLIILFYITRLSAEENRRQLLLTLIISASLVSLYSLYAYFVLSKPILEYVTRYKICEPFAREFLARKRAYSPFFSPNLLANYLLMIIMLSLGAIFGRIKNSGQGGLRIIGLFCILVSTFVLLLTQSLGGWIAFLFAVCIFSFAAQIVKKRTVIALCLIAVLILIVISLRMQGDKEFTKPSFSFHKRLFYWAETIKIIRHNPLTGIGTGNLLLKETRFAHNSYLQLWAETGILGIASWLGIIFLFLKRAVGNLTSSGDKFFWAGVLCSGFGFLFHNIVDFSFFIPQVSFLWWILLGLTLSGAERPICLKNRE